jgi:hypothetical protein
VLLRYRRGRLASPEDQVIVDTINAYYEAGGIDAAAMPLVRAIFDERVRRWRAEPPEPCNGHDFTAALQSTRGIIRSTVFHRVGRTEYLFSASTGALLASGVPHSLGPGVLLEMLVEIVLLVTELWTHVGEGAKKAAEEVFGKVVANPRVGSLLEKLIRLFRAFGSALSGESASRELRAVLSELFTLIKDSFKEFLGKVLESLDGLDILFMLLDILLMFTPVGWAKKYGRLLVGLGLFITHTYKKLNE